MTNASNHAATDKAAALDRYARQQMEADFLWLMNQEQGRRFMWELLSKCNLFSSSFNTHGGLMTLAEGKKQIGYQYLQDINTLCPALYVQMMEEANEAQRSRQLQLEQAQETETND